MKRIISLVFVTLMLVNIAVSGVSAVRYIDDDFSAVREDWWVYGGFSPEIDKGYVEGYSDAVILQTAYDNSLGETNMQGNGVWDQYTVKADMILVEAEQDDPHCGIWYADYTGVINPATGIPSEARNPNKFHIWYYPLTGTFTVERETNEEGNVVLFTKEDKNYKYKMEEGDDPITISLGYRAEKGKLSFYVDDKFLYETEFESIGTYKTPIVFWNRGLHLRFDRIVVGDLDEIYPSEPHVHDFSGREELIDSATCTKEGCKKVYCTGDGCDEYTVVAIPKAAHTAGEWEIIDPATCKQSGTNVRKCIGCGKVMETANVDMLKHTYVDTVTPPTPTSQGYTLHKCAVCGYQYMDSYTDYVEENPAQIIIETKKTRAGKTVLVNVKLQDNPGIWGMDIAVNYDKKKLTLNSVINGTVFADNEWTKGNLSGEEYILSYEAGEFDNITENGVITTLEFTVSEDAQTDDFYEISVSYMSGDIINADFEEIKPIVMSGGIKVVKVIYGDLNGDGVVNKKDSLLMKKYLADNTTDIDQEAADVFSDGVINKKDSLYLKQFLAGLDVELGA